MAISPRLAINSFMVVEFPLSFRASARFGHRGPTALSGTPTGSAYAKPPTQSRLRKDCAQARQHLVHDRFGNRFKASSASRQDVERTGLITANHAGRTRASLFQGNRKAALSRELSSLRDGNDNGRPRQLVERRRRDNDDWPRSSLLMSCRRVEADKPNVAPLHLNQLFADCTTVHPIRVRVVFGSLVALR